jgi:polysaccharide export outer membrane protein
MQALSRSGKELLSVSMACCLVLVPLPLGEALAQAQQGQHSTESPPQSVDVPQQETNPELPETANATAPPVNYLIGPEDLLNIDVFNVPELSRLVVRVGNDGSITLPLLGQVRATGFTTEQLRNELQSDWGETYLQNPQVTVFVQEFHARPASVIGAVDRPGLYYLAARRTLIEVLSMAGGLAKRTNDAPGRTVLVTRRDGFGDVQLVDGMRLVTPEKLEINLRKLLYSHEDALNIEIKPFDTVSVTRADIVYVVGEVKKPGGFLLQDQEKVTVLQALALAEGLTGTAGRKSAKIIHRSEDGSRTEIPIDLSKVLKGKSRDLELAANDVLFVPTSSGKAAAKRGLEAVVGTVSGVLIYRVGTH